MKVRNKASSHAFLLLALMPIPQFIHPVPRMCGVFEECLFHQCLDIVLEPLKVAACFSRMMSNPVGNLWYCFTYLVSYIIDTPEACMLACHALSATELDFQFSIIPHITSIHHFSNGIMKLKQVGGRVQRDVQQYIIIFITGAADLDVITAICSLMEFQYLSQATTLTSMTCDKIRALLQEFHNCRNALIEKGLCHGKKTKCVLKHWQIPKLELMQSVTPSVKCIGSILQWSADTTEHAHIEVIKDLASTTNNHNYDTQMCQCLDHYRKCQLFDTALALHGLMSGSIPVPPLGQDTDDNDLVTCEGDKDRNILDDIWAPKPLCTFITGSTAIHLNYAPLLKHLPIDTVAEQFNLFDLHGALGDYLNCEGNFAQNLHTFGKKRRSPLDIYLPIKELDVWYKVQFQQKAYHNPSEVASMFTVHAHPPDGLLKYGQYNAAIMNIDDHWQWPSSGLQGHAIIQDLTELDIDDAAAWVTSACLPGRPWACALTMGHTVHIVMHWI
ncbi:hypothetical protein EDC04DRAFT_2600357 [Pisolithus marmoratus]|nr:hypothetical protein EDC04DRAFT_2600357 [Pisolithus marmoratus]